MIPSIHHVSCVVALSVTVIWYVTIKDYNLSSTHSTEDRRVTCRSWTWPQAVANCVLLHHPCLSHPGSRECSGIHFPQSHPEMIPLQSVSSPCFPFWMSSQTRPTLWFYRISLAVTTLYFMTQAMVVLLNHLAVGAVPVRLEQA